MVLAGISVLIIEDEALIAMELEMAVENAGASIVGPIGRLDEGVKAAQERVVDVALLDIDLGGQESFPIADILIERGVPFVFHTGHGQRHEIAKLYPEILVCTKPTGLPCLIDALSKLSHPPT
ncbi:response regulator [Allopontixanthobacter sediminis]|uniref:Response regulator n=1 Tax=Allopontixanthobacter sediminis TaxID=1689985 RepID=A0A845B4K0_9SPHN|nr:response regulator [Allopontixanthobacter sediminis]MXP45328.1 response regulator [Allopontixanthobacter sediminis]